MAKRPLFQLKFCTSSKLDRRNQTGSVIAGKFKSFISCDTPGAQICNFRLRIQNVYTALDHCERGKSLEEFFSSSGNAIWSILLKYQEIEMQIQVFTDEN